MCSADTRCLRRGKLASEDDVGDGEQVAGVEDASGIVSGWCHVGSDLEVLCSLVLRLLYILERSVSVYEVEG